MPRESRHRQGEDGPELELPPFPGEDEAPTFEAPWQARVFGLAVSMYRDGGHFEWRSFQERLAAEIETDGPIDPDAVEAAYYRRWLAALEQLLVETGYLTDAQLRARALEFDAGDRTAAEFVEGEHDH